MKKTILILSVFGLLDSCQVDLQLDRESPLIEKNQLTLQTDIAVETETEGRCGCR